MPYTTHVSKCSWIYRVSQKKFALKFIYDCSGLEGEGYVQGPPGAKTLDPARSPHSRFETWTILKQTFFCDTLYTYKRVDNHIPLGLTNWKCQVCSHGRRREGIFGMLLIWQITYLLSFHHKFWDGGQNNPKIGNFMLRRGGVSVLCRAGPSGFNPCWLSSWEGGLL